MGISIKNNNNDFVNGIRKKRFEWRNKIIRNIVKRIHLITTYEKNF